MGSFERDEEDLVRWSRWSMRPSAEDAGRVGWSSEPSRRRADGNGSHEAAVGWEKWGDTRRSAPGLYSFGGYAHPRDPVPPAPFWVAPPYAQAWPWQHPAGFKNALQRPEKYLDSSAAAESGALLHSRQRSPGSEGAQFRDRRRVREELREPPPELSARPLAAAHDQRASVASAPPSEGYSAARRPTHLSRRSTENPYLSEESPGHPGERAAVDPAVPPSKKLEAARGSSLKNENRESGSGASARTTTTLYAAPGESGGGAEESGGAVLRKNRNKSTAKIKPSKTKSVLGVAAFSQFRSMLLQQNQTFMAQVAELQKATRRQAQAYLSPPVGEHATAGGRIRPPRHWPPPNGDPELGSIGPSEGRLSGSKRKAAGDYSMLARHAAEHPRGDAREDWHPPYREASAHPRIHPHDAEAERWWQAGTRWNRWNPAQAAAEYEYFQYHLHRHMKDGSKYAPDSFHPSQ